MLRRRKAQGDPAAHASFFFLHSPAVKCRDGKAAALLCFLTPFKQLGSLAPSRRGGCRAIMAESQDKLLPKPGHISSCFLHHFRGDKGLIRLLKRSSQPHTFGMTSAYMLNTAAMTVSIRIPEVAEAGTTDSTCTDCLASYHTSDEVIPSSENNSTSLNCFSFLSRIKLARSSRAISSH